MGKLVGKKGVDPEEVNSLVREGWGFRIKVVKGRRYITARRGQKERSFGPYSEELWVHIQRLRRRNIPTRPVSSLKEDVSVLTEAGNFDIMLNRFHDRIQLYRGVYMAVNCLFRGDAGYCEYWVLEREPEFMVKAKRFFGESLVRKVYYKARGTERWEMQALPFTCKGCSAFIDKRIIESISSKNQNRG